MLRAWPAAGLCSDGLCGGQLLTITPRAPPLRQGLPGHQGQWSGQGWGEADMGTGRGPSRCPGAPGCIDPLQRPQGWVGAAVGGEEVEGACGQGPSHAPGTEQRLTASDWRPMHLRSHLHHSPLLGEGGHGPSSLLGTARPLTSSAVCLERPSPGHQGACPWERQTHSAGAQPAASVASEPGGCLLPVPARLWSPVQDAVGERGSQTAPRGRGASGHPCASGGSRAGVRGNHRWGPGFLGQA